MSTRLSGVTKTTLKKASRDAVEESFSLLKRHLKKSRWIGVGNRYSPNTIDRLNSDSRPGRNINHQHLSQYIAASAPLHCADGWALLGRALDCHFRRDQDSARHFAYYAELRAAFALLATEGIAIFNRDHFVVDHRKQCFKFGGSTHQVVWQVLEHWGGLKRCANLLGLSIQVNGVTLREWLDHFAASGSFRAIGSRWLRTWGLDLRVFADDQEVRNEASYRPTKLLPRSFLDVKDSADFVCALWALCEPSAQSQFEGLDRYLLRLALEETFRGVRGTTATMAGAQFRSDIKAMVSQVVSDAATHSTWVDFLARATDADDPIIVAEAGQTDSVDSPRQHLQMISRAALLLRVATGANSRLLKESGVSADDLKFWWSALGEERGLWDKTSEPVELRDLWADAELALKGLKEWTATTTAPNRTLGRWRQENSYDIAVLGGCERIALWGLGL